MSSFVQGVVKSPAFRMSRPADGRETTAGREASSTDSTIADGRSVRTRQNAMFITEEDTSPAAPC